MTNRILLIVSASALFFLPQMAFAEDNTAKDLGWVSIGSGVLANVPFLVYNRVKKYSVVKLGGGHEVTRGMALQHGPVMTFHTAMNLIGFAAGAVHGMVFFKGLDAFSISLAIMMTVLTISGMVMRFVKSANIRLVTRVIHGQMLLSGILAVLIMLHVLTAYND